MVLHVKYTAREGGSSLKNSANAALQDQLNAIEQALGKTGLHLAINLKHDMPNEWHLLKNNGNVEISIDNARLPYMAQAANSVVEELMLIANSEAGQVDVNSSTVDLIANEELGLSLATIDTTNAFTLSGVGDNLEELVLAVRYSFEVGGS